MHCSEDFIARTTVTKYCSHKCSRAAYKANLRGHKVSKSDAETKALKVTPIEKVKSKEFLTVRDVATLMNCSIRTAYRLISNGTIHAINLSERKTTIRRSDLDKLFENNTNSVVKVPEPSIELHQYQIEDCYNMTEVQNIYGISEKALYEMIKRNNIPKIKNGWYSYVPKPLIDELLGSKKHSQISAL